MKSSKRYLLVALVLLLATVFCYSLALADDKPITKVTITPKANLDFNLYGDATPWQWTVGTDAAKDFVIAYEPSDASPVNLKLSLDNTYTAHLHNGEYAYDNILEANQPGKVKLTVDAIGTTGVIATASVEIEFKQVTLAGMKFTNTEPIVFAVTDAPGWIGPYEIERTKYEGVERDPTFWDFDWDSSNKDVGVIDTDGQFYPLSAGKTTITATPVGTTIKATVEVTVEGDEPDEKENITSLKFTQDSFKLNKNNYSGWFEISKFLKIGAPYAGQYTGMDDQLVITNSNPDYVEVDYDPYDYWYWDGYSWRTEHHVFVKPKAGKTGSATITVSSKNNPSIKASCTVSYSETFATGLKFPENEFTVKKGQKLDLSNYITVEPDGTYANIKYISSDETVASVAGSVVTGLKAGEKATITATVVGNPDATPATCTITVEEAAIAPTAVTFTPAEITVSAATSVNLSNYYQITPKDATGVFWSIDNTEIATLTGTTVAAKTNKSGKVTVTAKDKDGKALGTFVINFIKNPATKIIVGQDKVTVSKGYTGDIWALTDISVEPFDTDDVLIWTSSDAQIANLDDGYLRVCDHTHEDGVATLTIASKTNPDVKATITLTVVDTALESIAFDQESIAYDYYYNREFVQNLSTRIKYTPEDASNKTLVWTSSDPQIATVDADGKINPKKAGEVKITATSKDNPKATATINVKINAKKAPEKIVFAPAAVTVDLNDGALALADYYQVTPLDAVTTYKIEFVSSNRNVVYANNENKTIVPYEVGTATVTAKLIFDDEIVSTADLAVTVTDKKAVKGIALSVKELTLDIEDEWKNISDFVTVTPYNANYLGIKWLTSDPTVAVAGPSPVDEDVYVVYPLKKGTATLTACVVSYEGNIVATADPLTVTVTDVNAPTAIGFTATEITVDVSEGERSLDEYYLVSPYGSLYDTIEWYSTDPAIAKVHIGEEPGDPYYCLDVYKAGTVTLVANVVRNGEIVTSGTVNVKVTDEKIAKAISFLTPALTVDVSDVEVDLDGDKYYVITPLETGDWVNWISSDPAVAYVDGGYDLIPVKAGTATITANVIQNETVVATATLPVTVTDKYAATAITISPAAVTVPVTDYEHDALDLRKYVTISPIGANYDHIVWVSSDPDVADVVEYAVIASKKGTATLTANVIYNDAVVATGTLTVTVTEIPTVAIGFAPAEVTVKLDNALYLSDYCQIAPLTASDYTRIYWVSDNPEIAAVDNESGWVTGKQVGSATITATVVDVNTDAILCSGTVKVNVKDIVLTGVAFQQTAYTAKLNSKKDVNIGWSYAPVNWDYDPDELEVLSSNTYVINGYSLSNGILTVHANRPGTAVITLKSKTNDAIIAQATVTVEAEPITSVKLRKNTLKLYYAETKNERDNADIIHNGGVYQSTYDLKSLLDIQPTNAYIDEMTWETSNSNVAFVYIPTADNTNNSGYSSSALLKGSGSSGTIGSIIAVGTGKATVSVVISDGVNTYKKDVDVIVLGKTVSLKLNKAKVTMNLLKGEEVTYQLKAYDDDTDEEVPVKWKSNKESVATVDVNGVVTAVKAGTAVITATTKDGTKTIATCTITVKKNLIKKIKTVDGKKTLTMTVGDVKELMNGDDALLVINPTYAYNKTLKYSSDKPKIVKVDKNGKMTAVGAGTAKITIKANDGSKKSLTLKVTVEKAENKDDNYR